MLHALAVIVLVQLIDLAYGFLQCGFALFQFLFTAPNIPGDHLYRASQGSILPFCILLLLQHCQKVRIALYLINILLDPLLPLQGRLQGLCRVKIIMAGLPVHFLNLAPIPAALFLLLLIAFALLLFLLFCLFLSV